MGIKNIFNKSLGIIGLQIKSDSYNRNTLIKLLKQGTHTYMTNGERYYKYNFNAVISDAVDTISSKVANLTPIIKKTDGEIIRDHEVLKFLQAPNKLQDFNTFMEAASTNYLINKNAYLKIIGNVDSKPSEIYNLANTWISISESPGIAYFTIETASFYGFLCGQLMMTKDTGRILAENNLSEMLHIKGFDLSGNSIEAVSLLESIQRELKIVDQSNNHNLNLLEKGFNSMGIINLDTDDDDSFEQFTKDMQEKRSGSGNAGNLLVAKGKDVNFKSFGQSNRDMEYSKSFKMAQDTSYQRYQIPKPLVEGSAQTYDNYHTARGALYDDSVFNTADKIYQSFSKMFKNRNMLDDDMFLTYDTSNISTLQDRKYKELKTLQESHILTLNEMRSIAGYEALEGGDVVMQPMNLAPVAEDEYTDDNLTEPSKEFVDIMVKNGACESEVKSLWYEYQQAFNKKNAGQ
jgi:HK97 family phage portal protein